MKVRVIGYWGAYPGLNEGTSGYVFESEGFHLLVDCGSGVLSKLQQYIKIEDIDAVILSHYHHDHIADVGPLQYARVVKRHLGLVKKELTIYGHKYDMEKFNQLTKKPDVIGKGYNPKETIQIGPFSISFLQTKHPAVCYAMRISDDNHTVVYTADTCYMEELIPFSKKADLLISECSFYADQNGANAGHMNSIEVGTIAQKAEVSHLLLSHLPHFGDHRVLKTEASTVYKGRINLAKGGWLWES